MPKMKWFIFRLTGYLILILTIIFLVRSNKILRHRMDYATSNLKAYAAESIKKDKEIRVFELSLNTLNTLNDSLMMQMKKVANESKIKDQKIKSLQYQLEHFYKKDTIILRDTIFNDPKFVLDTCIRDEWNKSCLHLEYPGIITLNNEFKNEKFVTIHSYREPIKSRKWFLPRLFTRKHTIIEVVVVDKNPYMDVQEQRYIDIIK